MRSKQMSSTLRSQIKTNKETNILGQEQLNKIQKIYEDKINLIQNKYDIAADKYNQLQEKKFKNGFNGGSILKNEFEKIMKKFRDRMK